MLRGAAKSLNPFNSLARYGLAQGAVTAEGGGTLSLIFPQNGVPPSFVNAVEDHSMTSIFSLRVRNEGGVFTIAGRLKSVTPTPL